MDSSNTVMLTMTFVVLGQTRDETLAAMDAMQFEIQNMVGGAPWLVPDDDIVKKSSPGLVLSDDYGMYYEGKRTIHFNGPLKDTGTKQLHDGFAVQTFGAS